MDGGDGRGGRRRAREAERGSREGKGDVKTSRTVDARACVSGNGGRWS